MAAIGFVLVALGWLYARMFGNPYVHRVNVHEVISGLMFLTGWVLLAIGVGIQLWHILP
jgi:hypothetical protein